MKLMTHQQKQGRRELALVEREDRYYILSDKVPFRRVMSLPIHDGSPPLPFRTSEFVVNNTFRAGGKIWPGHLLDEDDAWHLAFYDAYLKSVVKGALITAAPDQPGANPKPISIAQDPNNSDMIYVVVNDGTVRFWNGDNSTVDTTYDAADWLKRTQTDTLFDVAGDKYGWGYNGDLYTDEPDLEPWAFSGAYPDGFRTWATADYAAAITNAGNTPGYGYFWSGQLAHIFYFEGRWWGLASGYMNDEGPIPATDFGPASLSIYACNAIWQCEADQDPADPAQWTRFKYPISPWNVADLHGEFNGADKLTNSVFYWVSWRDNQPYIAAMPFQPNTIDDYNQAAVYTITAGGAVEPFFTYQNVDSYSGPLMVVGNTIYVVVSDNNTQRVQIWAPYDNPLLDPELVSEVEWLGDPHLATTIYLNGGGYIVLGQDHDPAGGDTLNYGDGASTGWGILRYDFATATWATATAAFPGVTNDAFGLWPRAFASRLVAGGQGGGGGGGPTPGGGGTTGVCGDYAVYQAPSIAFDLFEDILVAVGSPILLEQTALYWWNVVVSYGINPAVALAFWIKESVAGAAPGQVLASSHNIGNIRPHDWGRQSGVIYTECCQAFSVYNTWEDGILDWCELFELDIYRDDLGAPLPLDQIIAIYAPSSDNNDPEGYFNQLCNRLIDWDA